MNILDRLNLFSVFDAIALGSLLLAWLFIGWRIENSSTSKPSVTTLMTQYRRDWMDQLITRDPRIFDSTILAMLRQSASFFASTTMIAIGGGLALLGNTDQLRGVAADLSIAHAPELVWEVKILLVVLFLSNAFLKFVWSLRLFGYCAVMMASVPNEIDSPLTQPRARQAAELNITAARSFNRGLRSVYFAMAALAWLLGPVGSIMATLFTFIVLWRREFASQSRIILMQSPGFENNNG